MDAQTVETAAAQPPVQPQTPAAAAPAAPERVRPSFRDFDAAETAKALGRQLPEKPAPAAEPEGEDAPAQDAAGKPILEDGKPISKRQHAANERIRQAVERGIADERTKREALEREIADLRRGAQPRQPEPPQAAQAAPTEDKEPVLDDFLNEPDPYLAHARALARWEVRQELAARDKTTQERSAAERQQQAVIDRVTAHQAREQAIVAETPDYEAKTLPIRQQMVLDSPLTLAVLESDLSARLILHFANHPADFQRIGELGSRNLPAALRELGKLEASFDKTPAAAAPAQPEPQPKTVSDAPAIGTTLGTQPAAAADASRAAVARKDFRAFDEEETRKDLARRRRK